MHNSEGQPQEPTPENPLLEQDCVGCHSSDSPSTIVTLDGDMIPIVFNTQGYPGQPLAGGNFYNVSRGGAVNDVYGHNVWGVSGVDANLASAPGDVMNCSNSCHESLATDPALSDKKNYGTIGCQGCHQSFKHHGVKPSSGSLETEESGWYRFLSGHEFDAYVSGIEDAYWEQNPVAGHNSYSGYGRFYSILDYPTGLPLTHSMTAFCRGCHYTYHSAMANRAGDWIRHPSDYVLPDSGEYEAYNPVANYDPEVPVAWVNPAAPARNEAVVMCLSCHRAHGSQYRDMLRWDYDEMLAHEDTGLSGKGCFVCHSEKDDQ